MDNKLHRTFTTNEYSARYSLAIDACHETNIDEWRSQSTDNKQGSGEYLTDWPENIRPVGHTQKYVEEDMVVCAEQRPEEWHIGGFLSSKEKDIQQEARRVYEERIKLGVAREQARKDLPLSNYTEFYWKGNLHNIFHYLGLRCDSHAQKEIRDYAFVIAGIVKKLFPLCFEAWYDYRFCSTSLSRQDRIFFNYLIKKYSFNSMEDLQKKFERSKDEYPVTLLGMSKREVSAFWNKFSVPTEEDFNLSEEDAEPFENFRLD